MGNRIAYVYTLTDVQTTGSTIHTPFKKITGYLVETASSITGAGATTIAVASTTLGDGNGTCAKVNLKSGATDADGKITVMGLL